MRLRKLNDWHAKHVEEVIEPDRVIIDPHHHLWEEPSRWGVYELEDLWADTNSGHNIEKTVFVEAGASYRKGGPEHLRPVGETEFVARVATESQNADGLAIIAGIVSTADLRIGGLLEEVLDEHELAGRGLFRGVRHSGAHDTTGSLMNPGSPFPCPYSRSDFREGLKKLGLRGYTFDAWHFFHQNRDFLDMARAVPETTMVLNHFGTPLGVGDYAGRREEIFSVWAGDVEEIAKCPNVFAKLGGLAMPDNGFGWEGKPLPPSSDEVVRMHKRYYLHTIECFGPSRCMFESNFPVDKLSLGYHVLWNAFKKISIDFSEEEKHALFYATANHVYRL